MIANDGLPIFQHDDGKIFLAESRHEMEAPGFGSMTAEDLRSLVGQLWQEAFEGKRAETERLKTCSLYYDGFHYLNAGLNRKNSVENYCFSTVETVWPLMTEVRPRAKISPRRPLSGNQGDVAKRLRSAAQWLMDADDFDHAYGLGIRDILKYGWGWWFIGIDPNTGMPYPKNGSVFNLYPDPTATNEDEMEYFFISQPVSTVRLQSYFPAAAGVIKPDGVASPAYDVHVKPYLEYLENAGRYQTANIIDSAPAFYKEGDPPPGNTVPLVASTGSYREHGQSTFLHQLYIRDVSLMKVMYLGTLKIPQPDGTFTVIPGMHHETKEPCCPSGWRVISMTYNGEFVEKPKTLDQCYGGTPVVFGFDYQQSDRFYPTGELDHAIPIQRGINRFNALLERAVELAANPAVVTNQDSGLPADISNILAGDILRVRRGSEVKFLEFKGPSESMFEVNTEKKKAMESVTGVQKSQQGERPAGIEAAAAIRGLKNAADNRIHGKEPCAARARSKLLKKMMLVAGKKLKEPFYFRGNDGQELSLTADEMLLEYDIQFEQGSGTDAGQQENLELYMNLFAAKAIDVQALLEAANIPDAKEIATRMMQQQMMEAVMIAKEKAASGPPQKKAVA